MEGCGSSSARRVGARNIRGLETRRIRDEWEVVAGDWSVEVDEAVAVAGSSLKNFRGDCCALPPSKMTPARAQL